MGDGRSGGEGRRGGEEEEDEEEEEWLGLKVRKDGHVFNPYLAQQMHPLVSCQIAKNLVARESRGVLCRENNLTIVE
jgi:hypothetical protein